VLLGDDIIQSKIPCIKQLIEGFYQYNSSVIAAQEVPMSKISQYGSIKGNKIGKNDYGDVYQIEDIVEKPSVEKAPSNLAAIGRYVFTPEIFDAIKKTNPGVNNELQIADSIVILGRSQKVYATSFTGKRYDIGDKLGYIQAIVDFSLENPEIGKDLKNYLKNLYL